MMEQVRTSQVFKINNNSSEICIVFNLSKNKQVNNSKIQCHWHQCRCYAQHFNGFNIYLTTYFADKCH